MVVFGSGVGLGLGEVCLRVGSCMCWCWDLFGWGVVRSIEYCLGVGGDDC